jgi:ribosomal protein S18 acetylase RimI-like enzyme
MSLEIREVSTGKELRKFIYLPKKFHSKDPNWLPPIWSDEWVLFNKRKNNSYKYADTIMLLAYRGKEVVGRIMGIISHRYNEAANEKNGRFCFIECDNDQEVFHTLVSAIEDWARKKRMVALVGPFGFSDKDPEGFIIEGYDIPQVMTSANNYPYMPELIEKEGYRTKKTIVNYHVPVPEILPQIYEKINSRVLSRNDLKVIEFSTKKELKPHIMDILELMNQVFRDIYGFVVLTETEKKELMDRYLMLIKPDFVKVVVNEKGTLVGFALGIPDLSEGIKRAKGRLLPFGIFHILRASHKSKTLLMVLGGILPEYRTQGIDTMMGARMLESAIRNKMKTIDSHLVLEDNIPMRGEYERLGGRIVKRFRVYIKNL